MRSWNYEMLHDIQHEVVQQRWMKTETNKPFNSVDNIDLIQMNTDL